MIADRTGAGGPGTKPAPPPDAGHVTYVSFGFHTGFGPVVRLPASILALEPHLLLIAPARAPKAVPKRAKSGQEVPCAQF